LEEANAQLRVELDQARANISKVEGHENILKSNYSDLRNDYKNLEVIITELQRELKQRKLVMLKLLRAAINFKSFAYTFAQGCVSFARN
jgi:chromosome segregation ATPase